MRLSCTHNNSNLNFVWAIFFVAKSNLEFSSGPQNPKPPPQRYQFEVTTHTHLGSGRPDLNN